MKVGLRTEGPIERLALLAGQVPTPLFESYVAMMAARAIMAGSSLGVFTALAEQPDDAAGLAKRLELDPAGTDVLLTALHTMGYLERQGADYRPAAQVKKWLLPGTDTSVDAFATVFGYDMWDTFGQLEETVRSGRQIGLHERPADDPYWERYMRGLFEIARLSSDIVARLIPAKDPSALVDLAGGHGEFSMALCRRHPGLKARIIELEGAAEIGRRIVEEQGMADRVSFEVGDLFEHDLGSGVDIVTANSIAHHFTPEQNVQMLERARAALRPGGTASIFELERPADGRRGTQLGVLTGVLFYITSKARTYSAGEIEGFFREAGFERVAAKHHPRLVGSVLVVGRAPG